MGDHEVAHALNDIGVHLGRRGKEEAALAVFEEAIELDPQYALAYYNMGNSLNILGQPTEAMKAYDSAIQYGDTGVTVLSLIDKGNIFLGWKRYPEALSTFNEAIRLNPQDSSLHFNKGNLLYDRGQYKESVQEYDIALRLNPQDTNITYNRELALKKAKRWW